MEEANNGASLEFKWLKKKGCGVRNKEVKFYESFIYDGVQYMLYDCVYLYKEDLQMPYIGKLIRIWENPDKSKKVKVHWFFHPGEVSNWLRETKPLENEIFLASGEGLGLANINPLEAICGRCNVVCVSNDSRNPQPSDEELKAADFIFYRIFDVQSCTISEKIDDKIGGLDIEYIFNKKGEKIIPNEENVNTNVSSEAQESSTKTNMRSERAEGDNGIPNLKRKMESDKSHDQSVKKTKPDDKFVESGVASGPEKMADLPLVKSKVDKGEMKVIVVVPADKVETKDRNKTPTGSNKLLDQPLKKINSDDKKPPEQSTVDSKSKKEDKLPAVANNLKASGTPGTAENQKKSKFSGKVSDGIEGKKLKVDKSPADVNNIKSSGTSDCTENQNKSKISGKMTDDSERKKLKEDNLPADVNNPKASGTSATTETPKNGKISGKVTDDSEGKKLKKERDDPRFKVPDNNKTWVSKSGKDLVTNSALSKEKSGNVDTNNKEAKEEPSGENKKKLCMNKPLEASTLSADKDKKNLYKKFAVERKPTDEKSNWFKLPPWEERLNKAYNQGTVILLHNLKPDYTSSDVEDIIWSAFKEKNCDAKILQRTAVSSPHSVQAVVILKTKEAAQRILTRLDEECMMLSDERPLVATPCPPISSKKSSTFFGHLAIDKVRFQNQREDEAVSTSHFSQPNTIEYDMAMEWCVLQLKSEKWWAKFYKQQGLELKRLQRDLKQK